MAAPVHTMIDQLVACGVSNNRGALGSAAQRISLDIFNDSYDTCMDISFEDLDNDLKTFSELTVGEGRIRTTVRVKKNMKAMIQWVRNEIRYGLDPSDELFDPANSQTLMRRYATHNLYVKGSKDLAKQAQPEKFKASMAWNDWKPTFINFLRMIPGLALLARRELLLGRLALLVGEAHLCVLCFSGEAPLSRRTLCFRSSFISGSTSTPISFRRAGRGEPAQRARSMSISSAMACVEINVSRAESPVDFYTGSSRRRPWGR